MIISLENSSKIRIGKLGKVDFDEGNYVYVGSAMNYLESRIRRHLSKEKKLHWHIDYLLKKSEISAVIYNESEKKIECELSQYISSNAPGIAGFGCSDCDCESHLYYFKNRNEAIECVENAYDSIAMNFEYFKI